MAKKRLIDDYIDGLVSTEDLCPIMFEDELRDLAKVVGRGGFAEERFAGMVFEWRDSAKPKCPSCGMPGETYFSEELWRRAQARENLREDYINRGAGVSAEREDHDAALIRRMRRIQLASAARIFGCCDGLVEFDAKHFGFPSIRDAWKDIEDRYDAIINPQALEFQDGFPASDDCIEIDGLEGYRGYPLLLGLAAPPFSLVSPIAQLMNHPDSAARCVGEFMARRRRSCELDVPADGLEELDESDLLRVGSHANLSSESPVLMGSIYWGFTAPGWGDPAPELSQLSGIHRSEMYWQRRGEAFDWICAHIRKRFHGMFSSGNAPIILPVVKHKDNARRTIGRLGQKRTRLYIFLPGPDAKALVTMEEVYAERAANYLNRAERDRLDVLYQTPFFDVMKSGPAFLSLQPQIQRAVLKRLFDSVAPKAGWRGKLNRLGFSKEAFSDVDDLEQLLDLTAPDWRWVAKYEWNDAYRETTNNRPASNDKHLSVNSDVLRLLDAYRNIELVCAVERIVPFEKSFDLDAYGALVSVSSVADEKIEQLITRHAIDLTAAAKALGKQNRHRDLEAARAAEFVARHRRYIRDWKKEGMIERRLTLQQFFDELHAEHLDGIHEWLFGKFREDPEMKHKKKVWRSLLVSDEVKAYAASLKAPAAKTAASKDRARKVY